jgi:hypothetical protein
MNAMKSELIADLRIANALYTKHRAELKIAIDYADRVALAKVLRTARKRVEDLEEILTAIGWAVWTAEDARRFVMSEDGERIYVSF